MRISSIQLNPAIRKQLVKLFTQSLADLKNETEASDFLNDFFTPSEQEAFIKRLAIAYWLKKKRTYANIKDNIKVSSATIASTEKDMEKPGYKLILKKIEAEEWANKWAEKIKNYTNSNE
jgi:TrpR-related protein YerC/YecD